jgi:type VI secretion system protein ImpB
MKIVNNTQHKLDRLRSPRVHITYDVEIGQATQKRELPFVVGILADLDGHQENTPRLRDRKFIEIDKYTINDIMYSISPKLKLHVKNCLGVGKEKININLEFSSIEDFSPFNIAKQVPALSGLYEARTKMKDLITKLDGNDELEDLLLELVNNPQLLEELKMELDGKKAPPSSVKKEDETNDYEITIESLPSINALMARNNNALEPIDEKK